MNQKMEVGKATEDQIAAWKAEHKNVLVIEIETEMETCYGYMRKYKRVHIEQAFVKSGNEGLLVAGKYLLDNLWLGGDARLVSDNEDDVDYALSAQYRAGSYVKFFGGEVKNL
jgi:hypothetical protein